MAKPRNEQPAQGKTEGEGRWVCPYELADKFEHTAKRLCTRTARFDKAPTLAKAMRLVHDYHDFAHEVLEFALDALVGEQPRTNAAASAKPAEGTA